MISDLCFKYSVIIATMIRVDPVTKHFERAEGIRKLNRLLMLKSSLKTIMRMMNAVYGKPVILLIDEYDVPLAKASEKNTAQNRYYEQMLDVIKGMLSIALKTNEYLKFAVVSGCLRIAKESIFTGTNNFAPTLYWTTTFQQVFRIHTDGSESAACGAAGLADKADIIQRMV